MYAATQGWTCAHCLFHRQSQVFPTDALSSSLGSGAAQAHLRSKEALLALLHARILDKVMWAAARGGCEDSCDAGGSHSLTPGCVAPPVVAIAAAMAFGLVPQCFLLFLQPFAYCLGVSLGLCRLRMCGRRCYRPGPVWWRRAVCRCLTGTHCWHRVRSWLRGVWAETDMSSSAAGWPCRRAKSTRCLVALLLGVDVPNDSQTSGPVVTGHSTSAPSHVLSLPRLLPACSYRPPRR